MILANSASFLRGEVTALYIVRAIVRGRKTSTIRSRLTRLFTDLSGGGGGGFRWFRFLAKKTLYGVGLFVL
jgi:hypothetical protein